MFGKQLGKRKELGRKTVREEEGSRSKDSQKKGGELVDGQSEKMKGNVWKTVGETEWKLVAKLSQRRTEIV